MGRVGQQFHTAAPGLGFDGVVMGMEQTLKSGKVLLLQGQSDNPNNHNSSVGAACAAANSMRTGSSYFNPNKSVAPP